MESDIFQPGGSDKNNFSQEGRFYLVKKKEGMKKKRPLIGCTRRKTKNILLSFTLFSQEESVLSAEPDSSRSSCG